MNKYFKRKWNETRGDEFDSWGTSTWYFEVDTDGYPTKQIELYENGNRLKYHNEKTFDDYGGLGDQALDIPHSITELINHPFLFYDALTTDI